MVNKKKLFIGMTLALALIFSITYYFSEKYISNKNAKNNPVSSSEINNKLNDNIRIYLYAGEKKEKELTLSELKKELNIDKNLTETELSKALKDKGYVLEVESNGEMTYKRDASKAVKPNKYYIGEKDGFLAIYKTDDNGTLSIENSEDVYTNSKKVDKLSEIDKDKIKNFELEYNSKDDAEESLSEFLS
ncbi:hypothetical protein CBE01nite_02350 [Clostridium beijerinckii]|uniref:Bypass of forespore C C-terminal domain-containing protein n=2 Tax=Clostridium beijerinckii TaxID=1520 RepID=A0AB74VJM6_CLOBE|nr:hypothetical protein [Clostridium beijerinckii]NRT88670.1 hypothetical protein [Clostridium beijerinckii]NRZ26062.1 hypothetical protein [Clostridium beijerinckii]NYB98576.1 hypothetical protein [Clostridium beijerinckii]NYC74125.1 hypothetical protein [Clostridium beijerinckii]OOM23781.1 hypothetical protein CLBEI_24620 [Clostridium beijerinckii]